MGRLAIGAISRSLAAISDSFDDGRREPVCQLRFVWCCLVLLGWVLKLIHVIFLGTIIVHGQTCKVIALAESLCAAILHLEAATISPG